MITKAFLFVLGGLVCGGLPMADLVPLASGRTAGCGESGHLSKLSPLLEPESISPQTGNGHLITMELHPNGAGGVLRARRGGRASYIPVSSESGTLSILVDRFHLPTAPEDGELAKILVRFMDDPDLPPQAMRDFALGLAFLLNLEGSVQDLTPSLKDILVFRFSHN